jgi:hypothetical protein
MFVALQFPFVDVRPFIQTETGRLTSPDWQSLQPDIDFVRSFGLVKRRLRGGVIEWPGEEMYCRALRALRFVNSNAKLPSDMGGGAAEARQYIPFRRFLADGFAMARFEIGFGYRTTQQKAVRLRSKDFISLIRFVLSQEVLVPHDSAQKTCTLAEAGQYLAKHYLRASQSLKASPPEDWWLASGDTLLLLEYDKSKTDILGFPKHARPVNSDLLINANINLAHMWAEYKGKQVGVWLLGYVGSDKLTRDLLRRLRLSLFRLHAERESMQRVFRLIARKKIEVKKDSPQTEQLQAYIDNATRILAKRSYDGLPQSAILDAAYQAEDLVSVGERATLLTQLAGVRRNLLHNVENFTSPHAEDKRTVYVLGDMVTNQTMTINNSTVENVNQVAAEKIEGSFNEGVPPGPDSKGPGEQPSKQGVTR